jgi:glycosyltransferase involved in cell wall biosynthesis
MRIAWFRPGHTDATNPLDSTAALIDELKTTHDITVIIETAAHDFVWRHLQQPWDVCVFELDNTRAHQFIWGYLPNYPGVVVLHSIDLANLRVAVLVSRSVVVSEPGLAERLKSRFPTATVRHAPTFAVSRISATTDEAAADRIRHADAGAPSAKFAVYDSRVRGHLIERAIERARNAGATFDVLAREWTPAALAQADVVIAPAWPPFQSSFTPLLAAMAAGKAVITTETETTAEWPAIDPQTWRHRGFLVNDAPVAVTVDPRDEEHSLMLAIRKLSADATLRDQLGRAARAWWEAHATPTRAASAWTAILEEAATLTPPPRGDDWPKQFLLDGTGLARGILSEFGLTNDV